MGGVCGNSESGRTDQEAAGEAKGRIAYHGGSVAGEDEQPSVLFQEYNCWDQLADLVQVKREDGSNNYKYGLMDILDYKT